MRKLLVRNSKKYAVIYAVVGFLFFASIPRVSAGFPPDPRTQIYQDPVDYGGYGDVGSAFIFVNSTHLIFQVNYEDSLPDSRAYYRVGEIWLNTDGNKSTGYRDKVLGADYRLDYGVLGGGFSRADLAYWNSTRSSFLFEYPVSFEVEDDYVVLKVPLSLLGMDNEMSFGFEALFNTQIRDWITFSFVYFLHGHDDVEIDGSWLDWKPENLAFSDPQNEYEEQVDFSFFYMADNYTHLFHRFDVKGEMPYIGSGDVVHGGELRIFYDIDNNSTTGSLVSGIGAEYLCLINTERSSAGEKTSSFGFLIRWNEDKQVWEWANQTRFTSVSIDSTFEFSLPVSEDGLNIANDTIRVLVAQYNSELHDSLPNDGSLSYKPPIIEVTEAFVRDTRVDVGTTQRVYFHARWGEGFGVSTGTLYVNGTGYEVNGTGWVSFDVNSSVAVRKSWTITGARSLDRSSFNQTASDPSIVWDKVEVIVPEGQRLNLGQEMPTRFARYAYDGSPLEGSIVLNDTLVEKGIGKYGLRVLGIEDSKYNLTSFNSEDFKVIVDMVNINLTLSDTRLDVWTRPKISVSGYYEYDSKPFNGTINVIEPQSLANVQQHTYRVNSISDQFGMTVFESNNITCVWDKILITEGGVSNRESIIGMTEKVWFTAKYVYDDDIFGPEDGVLYVDWDPCEWDEENQRWVKAVAYETTGTKYYFITNIKDEKYGLTVFSHSIDELAIKWVEESIQIPGFHPASIAVGLMVAILVLYQFQRIGVKL